MSSFEKQLSNNLIKVDIKGKRERHVPDMFTKKMKCEIDVLINMRKAVGIPVSNPYVFAVAGQNMVRKHLRGSDRLRYFAQRCRAKNP